MTYPNLPIKPAATQWAELPFGGVRAYGYGSAGGPQARDACAQTKTVAMMSV